MSIFDQPCFADGNAFGLHWAITLHQEYSDAAHEFEVRTFTLITADYNRDNDERFIRLGLLGLGAVMSWEPRRAYEARRNSCVNKILSSLRNDRRHENT